MVTLSRHIEALLVRHNCVIVPKLGGFVAHYTPAHFDAKEGYFVPPYRNVAFNSMLAINDGLLIERYSKEEELCYTDAVRLIDAHVNQLKDVIAEQGEAELVGIGILSSNGEGGYSFEPRKNGIMTPYLYSLEYTEISTFSGEVEGDTPTNDANDSKRNYIIRLNRTAVNYLCAAVITMMFYFLLAPIGITNCKEKHEASMVPTKVTVTTTTKSTPAAKAEEIKPEVVNAPNEATPETETIGETAKAIAKETPKAPAEEVVPTEEYVIVLASAISKAHAENFAEKLQKENKKSVRVLETETMRRVVLGNFSSYEEAKTYQNTLTNEERFADCWVLKL